MLLIDGKQARIYELKDIAGCWQFVRVITLNENGQPSRQHNIPRSGKFRINGHQYEWVSQTIY